jgi:hypothetical protein
MDEDVKIWQLRKYTSKRFELFFDFREGGFVLLIREWKFQLVFLFFLGFFQLLTRAFDGKAFGIEQALDVEQKLNIFFLVETMARRRLRRLEQIKFSFPVP